MSRFVQTFQDLDVYRAAFKLQQKLFTVSKRWVASTAVHRPWVVVAAGAPASREAVRWL